jgi:opacity protein-like surface antigen
MKVRTGALLAMGLALIASPGYAQGVTAGAKVGVNFANVSVDAPDDSEFNFEDQIENKTGLVVGGFVEAPITPQFSVQPEVLFSMKGFKIKDTDPDIKTEVNVVEIPILAKFKFATMSSAKPYIVAGPGFGFVASAKQKEEGFDDVDLKELDVIEKFDPSFITGGGVDINKFLVEVRYDWGLKDLDKDSDSNLKSRTFSILVGYSFK